MGGVDLLDAVEGMVAPLDGATGILQNLGVGRPFVAGTVIARAGVDPIHFSRRVRVVQKTVQIDHAALRVARVFNLFEQIGAPDYFVHGAATQPGNGPANVFRNSIEIIYHILGFPAKLGAKIFPLGGHPGRPSVKVTDPDQRATGGAQGRGPGVDARSLMAAAVMRGLPSRPVVSVVCTTTPIEPGMEPSRAKM